MNVLVVGGAGYIGAHIVDLLCRKGYSVTVFDNLESGFSENLNSSSIFIKGDILNKESLDLLFKENNYDSIIHMASLKSTSESMKNPNFYTENNILGSINLINHAISNNIKKIIFSSTAAVYGKPMYNPIDEKHSTNPINYYGFTKLSIENYLKWLSNMNKIKYVSLRYFNVAGYSRDKELIKFTEKNPQNLLPIIMEVLKGSRNFLKIYGKNYNTKDGTCLRDYINVIDLANAHVKSLQYLESNESTVLNLSSSKSHSVLDVISCAEAVTGVKVNYKYVNRREGDPEILFSSYKKAKRTIGWKPEKSSLEEIVSSMWSKYRA